MPLFVGCLGSPDSKYFLTMFFLNAQSAVPFPLTAIRCAIWFWWLFCRQDWTCQFWERATSSRFSKNVHVGLLRWLWIQCFFCVCQGALPGCLPPFKQRWHLVTMTKMTRYKEKLTGMKQCGEARVGDLPKEKWQSAHKLKTNIFPAKGSYSWSGIITICKAGLRKGGFVLRYLKHPIFLLSSVVLLARQAVRISLSFEQGHWVCPERTDFPLLWCIFRSPICACFSLHFKSKRLRWFTSNIPKEKINLLWLHITYEVFQAQHRFGGLCLVAKLESISVQI